MRATSCATACSNRNTRFDYRAAWAAFFLFGNLLLIDSSAEGVWTQKIDLVSGWNAVFVELDPLETVPADLFEGLPVDVAAGFSSSAKSAQFVVDPTVDMLMAYGWNVWYSPRRADHFLSTLSAIQGGNPYLIHATTNTQLVIQGTIAPDLFAWTPDAYNFVGFSVAGQGGPTFAEFFSGSATHDTNRIYRMVNGTWRLVTDPAGVGMRPGEAFWTYCEGRSSFRGPVEFATSSKGGVILSTAAEAEIVVRNNTPHPVTVTLEHVVDAAAPVPLISSITVYDLENSIIQEARVSLGDDAWSMQLPPIEAGAGVRFPLALDRQRANFSTRHSTIKATTDLGTIAYLPVTAFGLESTTANDEP
jgi:hypothetical protein